jgi:hypothetical protein
VGLDQREVEFIPPLNRELSGDAVLGNKHILPFKNPRNFEMSKEMDCHRQIFFLWRQLLNGGEVPYSIFDFLRKDLVNWSMNLPPSVKPNGDRTFEITIKIYEPRMGEILILIQKNFVPGFNIIMVTISNFSVGKTSRDKRRCSPILLCNKFHYEQRMKGNTPRDSLAWNRSNLDGLSDKEYVPVKLNGLIWVDGRKMPTGRVVCFGNFIRGFYVTKIRLNQEQVVGRFFDMVGRRLRVSYEGLLRGKTIKRTWRRAY